MCFRPGCTAPNALGSRFVAGACAGHFKQVQADLGAKFPALKSNAALLNDVALAYVLMCDEDAVLDLVGELDALLSGVDPEYARLSAALEYHELLCWFPRVRVTPAGVLSANDFLDLIAKGCVLKDVGAGAPHGRLTHRVQWYALMAAMTDRFRKPFVPPFNGSPLQLYCKFGDRAMVNGSDSLWGEVFDMGGSSAALKFRAPDRLHAALLRSGGAVRVTLSRKRDEDARNLAAVVRSHIQQADRGNGPLAAWVQKGKGGPVLLGFQRLFGLGRAFTFEELYDFLDETIYRRTTTQGYPNAYLYIVTTGTPAATRMFLESRKMPTNLDVVVKKGFYPPDKTTIQSRIAASLKDLNWVEVKAFNLNLDKRQK